MKQEFEQRPILSNLAERVGRWMFADPDVCECGHTRNDHKTHAASRDTGSCRLSWVASPLNPDERLCQCRWFETDAYQQKDVALWLYNTIFRTKRYARLHFKEERRTGIERWSCACGSEFKRSVGPASYPGATQWAVPVEECRYAQAHLAVCPIWVPYDRVASMFFGVTPELLQVVLDLALEQLPTPKTDRAVSLLEASAS